MADARRQLEGTFIAANTETRTLAGDVRVTSAGLEFANGITLETEFVDIQHATIDPAAARGDTLPFGRNPNGHWAEMRRVNRETTAKGAASIAKRDDNLTLQYDEPASSLQITTFAKKLFGGVVTGPLLVYLSQEYAEAAVLDAVARRRE